MAPRPADPADSTTVQTVLAAEKLESRAFPRGTEYDQWLFDPKRSPEMHEIATKALRHTFATLQLSAGVHFMQVSKWLGHSTFTLTLDVYGDYIPEAGRRRGEQPARTTRPGGEAGRPTEQCSEFVRRHGLSGLAFTGVLPATGGAL